MASRAFSRNAGFSLIEMIIVVAIFAVAAGAIAPLAVRMVDSSRRDVTLKRQQLIYRAIFGDSSAPGSGFLSDIGRLPASDLSELAVAGSLPLYNMQPCGVGMGWRGPYLLEGVDSTGRPLDGWGTPMDMVNGQIRSAGPDRSMTDVSDNLYYPSTPINLNNVTCNLALEVLAIDNSTAQPLFVPAGGQATVCYARNGSMHSVSLLSASGTYVFPPSGMALPQGIYGISVIADPDGLGSQPAINGTLTAFCPGGGTVHQTLALR